MTDSTDLTTYRQSLILALRLKDVPGERIGEIVAEVESHVSDSGEDPTEAFGSPREYADSLTTEHHHTPWWSTAIVVAWSLTLTWFITQGALALLVDGTYLGQSGWPWLALGLVIGVPGVLVLHRQSSRVLDPRTREDMVPPNPKASAMLVGLPVAIVLLSAAVIRLFG